MSKRRKPNSKTAQALYQLASDQETAGLAPNIDTLRARVQLQAQQEALIQAQNDLEKQRIALARVIGLPMQQKFQLVNRVPYHPVPDIVTSTAPTNARCRPAPTTRPRWRRCVPPNSAARRRGRPAALGRSLRNLRRAGIHARCHGAATTRLPPR